MERVAAAAHDIVKGKFKFRGQHDLIHRSIARFQSPLVDIAIEKECRVVADCLKANFVDISRAGKLGSVPVVLIIS